MPKYPLDEAAADFGEKVMMYVKLFKGDEGFPDDPAMEFMYKINYSDLGLGSLPVRSEPVIFQRLGGEKEQPKIEFVEGEKGGGAGRGGGRVETVDGKTKGRGGSRLSSDTSPFYVPAVQDYRDGPVIYELHFHMGRELSLLYGDALILASFAEGFV